MSKYLRFFSQKKSVSVYWAVFLHILIVLFFFSLTRLAFYFTNLNYFSGTGLHELIRIFAGGMRFDLSAVLMINAVYILFQLIPLNIRFKNWYQKTLMLLFYITNSIALVANFSDCIYFRFTAKRLTSDIFSFLSVGGDFNKLLPQFIIDYWYIVLLWVIFSVAFIMLISMFKFKETITSSFKIYLKRFVYFFISLLITIVGIRGGLQLKPLDIINASNYAENKNLPLVLNSPFTIIKTMGLPSLTDKVYITDSNKLKEIYSPIYLTKENKSSFRNLNVVIIILESFSQEHIGALNHINGYTGFTPFLDSLLQKAAYIKGFANGKRSIEGIPAILAGIPTLMNESYITSMYAGNKINSLASLLRPKGYHTSFYHGGSNGTMGFESFTKAAGFDTYYGRSQYNNEADYDGKWGIWDEAFLQNYARQLNSTPQPFLSAVFTLSSHHPYKVPDKYKGKFRKGKLEIQESIMYADYSLQRFFETAATMPWYDSTLFVITADHTSEADLEYYKNDIGRYAIPILFYLPGSNLKTDHDQIGQQLDIMPSVLDFLNFDKPYFSFGTSVFDSLKPHFNITYINEAYQLIKDNYVLKFDGDKSISLYQIKQDSLLKHNLITTEIKQKNQMELFLKALIQQYNTSLRNNKMMVEVKN